MPVRTDNVEEECHPPRPSRRGRNWVVVSRRKTLPTAVCGVSGDLAPRLNKILSPGWVGKHVSLDHIIRREGEIEFKAFKNSNEVPVDISRDLRKIVSSSHRRKRHYFNQN